MAEDGSSFLWAFDRLLDAEGLTIEDLTKTLLPALRLAEPELHESTRARLCLRQLEAGLAVGGVDEDSLSSLHKLLTFDVRGLADPALVAPPPPLLLRVRCGGVLQQRVQLVVHAEVLAGHWVCSQLAAAYACATGPSTAASLPPASHRC